MDNKTNLALMGNGKKENRRALDFYPTPPEATIALMEFLKLDRSLVVWEPACGDGAMVDVILNYGHYVIGTDIRSGYDYLRVKSSDISSFSRFDAIITNPPFNLSQKFIEKAVTEADTVAMLLKSQYWHAASRYELFANTRPTYVLPLTWRPDFMNGESGGRPTMEVAWTVWIKGSTHTEYHPLQKPTSK